MQARDIMTRPVIMFRPETPVREAVAVLTEQRITAAPVVDDAEELVGIVSEADLIADRFGHDPRSHARRDVEDFEPASPQTVGEVMTTTVVALSASADAADIAEAMLSYDVRSIPIVEGGSVVGIISRRDLLHMLTRADESIRDDVRHRLDAYTGGRSRWDVLVDDGRVDVYGDIADDAELKVLLSLARTVPGVSTAQVHDRVSTHC